MGLLDVVWEAVSELAEKTIAEGIEKAGALAEVVKSLGGPYILILVGMWFLYQTLKKHLPLLIAAFERNQRDKRAHIRKLEQIRQGVARRQRKRKS